MQVKLLDGTTVPVPTPADLIFYTAVQGNRGFLADAFHEYCRLRDLTSVERTNKWAVAKPAELQEKLRRHHQTWVVTHVVQRIIDNVVGDLSLKKNANVKAIKDPYAVFVTAFNSFVTSHLQAVNTDQTNTLQVRLVGKGAHDIIANFVAAVKKWAQRRDAVEKEGFKEFKSPRSMVAVAQFLAAPFADLPEFQHLFSTPHHAEPAVQVPDMPLQSVPSKVPTETLSPISGPTSGPSDFKTPPKITVEVGAVTGEVIDAGTAYGYRNLGVIMACQEDLAGIFGECVTAREFGLHIAVRGASVDRVKMHKLEAVNSSFIFPTHTPRASGPPSDIVTWAVMGNGRSGDDEAFSAVISLCGDTEPVIATRAAVGATTSTYTAELKQLKKSIKENEENEEQFGEILAAFSDQDLDIASILSGLSDGPRTTVSSNISKSAAPDATKLLSTMAADIIRWSTFGSKPRLAYRSYVPSADIFNIFHLDTSSGIRKTGTPKAELRKSIFLTMGGASQRGDTSELRAQGTFARVAQPRGGPG